MEREKMGIHEGRLLADSVGGGVVELEEDGDCRSRRLPELQ